MRQFIVPGRSLAGISIEDGTRVRQAERPSRRAPDGEYVLYWIRVNRRVESNHALVFAAGLANRLGFPCWLSKA